MKRYASALLLSVLVAGSTIGQTYVNGPTVTHPTGGFGGAPASALEATLNNVGFGCGGFAGFNNRLADEFTVPCGETWTLTNIRVFGYQTQAAAGPFTTVSTFTGANYRIWSGQPGLAGSTILNDFSAVSQQTGTGFTGIYRVPVATLTNQQRPVFYSDMNANGIVLTHGTYWLDFQIAGTGTATVFTGPVTILGSQTTGNGVGFQGTFVVPNATGSWNNALLSGTTPANTGTQGIPFEIGYTLGGGPTCFVLDISQPGGPGAPLFLSDTGGIPGNTFVNVITLAAGAFPNGWLYGIDISMPELLNSLNAGLPFIGTLDGSGSFLLPPVVLGLPFPITAYYVGIQLNGASVVNTDVPKSVTINP